MLRFSGAVQNTARSVVRHVTNLLAVFAVSAVACGTPAAAQTTVSIHDIMTSLPNSPRLGQNVTTSGIVVGAVSSSTSGANNGFYISLKTYDNDVNTSEGIFVAGSSIAGCQVSVGQVATVTGVVTNSTAPNLTAANTPGTYLVPSACSTSGTDATSATISLSGVLTSFGDALKYTGMSISNRSFYAVQPTTGTIASTASSVTSTGQFWATLNTNTSTNNHLFRSAGIAVDEYKPSGAPAGVPTWNGNPQRVLIDTTSFGGSPVDITVGQTITCTNSNSGGVGPTSGIGLMDYTLGYARVMIFKAVTCAVSGNIATSVSAVADTTHFKVGTLDVNTFLGSASIFQTALAKAVLTVKNVFGSPDIFAMQEVGNQATLQTLADAVNTANSGSTNYIAIVPGTDTVNSGYLVNTNTLKNTNYQEAGRGATYVTASGGSATLWDHPPVVLTGEFVRVGRNYPVTVINVHMLPRDNSGDSTLGPNIRARRAAQASAVSSLVQQYQSAGANVIVAGNFNSYEYNDGYVDVVGVIDGAPAAATAVTTYQATSTTAPLTEFSAQVTVYSRYNIIERGNAASLEHILASSTVTNSATASASLASYINTVTQPHFSTDYSAVSANDATTPAGLTPHDGFLVNFAIPPVPTTATLTPTALNFGDVSLTDSKTLALTFTNTSDFSPATINVTNIAISGANAGDFTQTSNCTAVTQNQTCTINVTFSPTAVGTRTGTITVISDSTSNPTLTASLTGNGVPTSATLSPTSATFPNTYAGGGVSPAQTFTVTNTSLIPIKVTGATTTTNFSVTANNCSTLAVGASCTVLVAFAPTTAGALTGALTVATNTSANPTLTATLTGTGLPTTATLSPATQNFGYVVLGDTSASVAFTYTNTSAITLTVTAAITTGDYRVVNNGCSSVAANASCAITIAFVPTVLGTRTGILTVTNTASANPTLTATLTGRGVADVEADQGTLYFGNVDVGATSSPQTVTLTNYTPSAIALTGITLAGSDFAQTATTCGATLAGKSSCTLTYVFIPTAIGVRSGAVTVTTNDTKYPVITVALTGNGVDFSLAIAPASGSQIAGNGTLSPALTVTPLGGFNAAIKLTCTFQAVASTCTLPNSAFTLSGTSTQNLAITTTSQYTVVGYGLSGGTNGFRAIALLLGMGAGTLLWFSRRRHQATSRLLLALAMLLLASAGLSGCSGKYPDQRSAWTEPGTYTYTVTATDGFLSHTATYTLTVSAR